MGFFNLCVSAISSTHVMLGSHSRGLELHFLSHSENIKLIINGRTVSHMDEADLCKASAALHDFSDTSLVPRFSGLR